MYKVSDCECGCGGKIIDVILGSPEKDFAESISGIIDQLFDILDTAKDIPSYIYIPPTPPFRGWPGTPPIYIDTSKIFEIGWIITGYIKPWVDFMKNIEDESVRRVSGREEVINQLVNGSFGQFIIDENGDIRIRPDIGPLPAIQDMLDKVNDLPSQDEVCQCRPEEPPQDTPPPYIPSDWDFWNRILQNMSIAHGGEIPVAPPKPPKLSPSITSPLILDLNGDGVKTTDVENGVYLDHDGSRFAVKSGWVSSEDALLVRDIDGNGQIDSGRELFGNNTKLSTGKNAANGFAALAEFDSNGDGIVDKNDERWSELKLWQDRNGDGKVDEGELLSLEEAGVAGINVGYKNQNVTDENGNRHLQGGTFIRDDGTTGEMNDVWFGTDKVDTDHLDDVEVPDDIKKLPNLRGWGEVRDMHQVMATDESGRLQALLEQFLAADPAEAKTLVWDIIYAWTGMTDVDPASYPRFSGDARMLLAMEALTDTKFGTNADGTFSGPNFGPSDHAMLKGYFAAWENKVTSYLLLSTHYGELYRLAVAGSEAYGESGDISAFEPLMSVLRAIYESGGDAGKSMIADFITQLRTYDSRGVACAEILKDAFRDPYSDDAFIRELSSGWDNWIVGLRGASTLIGTSGDDTLYGSLYGGSVDEDILGGDGNDNLYARDGDDVIFGEAGDDLLDGDVGNDVLHGGAGNDKLYGGVGDDVYLFGIGDGNDIIEETLDRREDRRNVIRLGEGIGPGDITLLNDNTAGPYMDLFIRINSTGETLTIRNGLASSLLYNENPYSIQAIEFADGTVWNWEDILRQPMYMTDTTSSYGQYTAYEGSTLIGNDNANELNGRGNTDVLHGGGGNDTITANEGNDILAGGTGDDTLTGGTGDDVYIYNLGDGNDTITETETRADRRNVIRFGEGIGPSDITLLNDNIAGSYMNFYIRINSTGEILTIKNGLASSLLYNENPYSIQAIEFADGTVWNWQEILRQPMYMTDTTTNYGQYTAHEGSTLIGNDSANDLNGRGNDDILHGGGGNDTITANAGNDILAGGTGNDTLDGGAGNDVLRGETGNDSLSGGAGDDVYYYNLGDGNDVIEDSGSDLRTERHNVLRLGAGITADGITLLNDNTPGAYMDLIIRINSTGETLTIRNGLASSLLYNENPYSIQAIEFADGTVWNWEDILRQPMYMKDTTTEYAQYTEYEGSTLIGNASANVLNGRENADVLHGGGGNDTLTGNAGNDILGGGTGNDTLDGGAGDDVYIYNKGDGNDTITESETRADRRNVIRFGEGIGPGDIMLFNDNTPGAYMDLLIRINSTGEILTIKSGLISDSQYGANPYAIQAFEFADGTVWNWRDILRQPMYIKDTTTEYAQFTAYDGSTLIGNGNANILNGLGNADVLHGGGGNDTLTGNAGNDILGGGTGNDTLDGGIGDDVYVYNLGDGNDTITESETRADRRNVIRFGEGIAAGDLEFIAKYQYNAYCDLVIRIKSTGETITIYRGFSHNYTSMQNQNSIQELQFADGTVWTYEDIMKQSILSDDTLSTIYADKNGSFLVGNALDNSMQGSAYADTLHGGNGNDTLNGNAGNDILWGGAGDDRMDGGAGNDVYLFGRGDGNDTVSDYESSRPDKCNIVRLGDGIGLEDIDFVLSGSSSVKDLLIRIRDTGESLTILRGMNDPNYGIQFIEFSDGTRMNWSDVEALINGAPDTPSVITGTDADDVLRGTAKNDTISGENGDDLLYGYEGNDTLRGGAGNDRLEGGIGDDTYHFGRGDGHDVVSDYEAGRASKRNVIRLGDGIGTGDIEFLLKDSSAANFMDLVIRIKSTGETLTMDRALALNTKNASNAYSMQAIMFADGTVWEWADIVKQLMTMSDGMTTAFSDVLGAFIQGNDSANTITGSATDDILYGGGGDDTVSGGAGNDVLGGGAGNDRLAGGAGNDMYLFGKGDGNDVVDSLDSGSGKCDGVKLVGLLRDDIEFVPGENGDFAIRIKATGESISILNGMSDTKYGIQFIEFADGTRMQWDEMEKIIRDILGIPEPQNPAELDPTIVGTDANDQLTGTAGNDIIFGGKGNDTLNGKDGNDILYGGAGNDALNGGNGDDVYIYNLGSGNDTITEAETRADRHNVIRLGEGIAADDLEFVITNQNSVSANLVIRIKSTGETITIANGFSTYYTPAQNSNAIQEIEFADGTVWTYEDIMKQPILGDDTSTAIYADKNGSILIGNTLDNTMNGSAYTDTLHGGEGRDTLNGKDGNDILVGGVGDDKLTGGNGDDVYVFNLGDGHDTITEAETRADRNNVIRLGEGIAADDLEFIITNQSSTFANLVIRIKSTGETITVVSGFSTYHMPVQNSNAIQEIEFADGTVWTYEDIMKQPFLSDDAATSIYADKNGSTLIGNTLANIMTGSAYTDTLYGGEGNDTLSGNAGNDILIGGAGDDKLTGGNGDDVYIFNLGDGHDIITESETRTDRHNVIRLGEGIVANDLEFIITNQSSVSANLVIRIKSTGETITITNGFSTYNTSTQNSNAIQGIEFADGTVWTYDDIMKQPILSADTATSIYADKNGSILIGSALDNTMTGSAYADTLYGGEGNDTLTGGAGDDRYVFEAGDGMDTVTDSSGNDRILFGEGIDLDDIWFVRSGNDLVIDILGSEDSVNVKNWFYKEANQVESIAVGGMELVNTQMNQLLQAMAGFGVPAGVDGRWTEEQKEAMAPVLSTYWRPTGS